MRKKCYTGQDTIVYDRNLGRVPWPMGLVHHILSTRYCKSATIGYSFNNVIVSFLKYPVASGQSSMLSFFCYSSKYSGTGIFLNLPIREILSLYFLPNRTKVTLFCYSARYRYPYFRVQIEMTNTGSRLVTFVNTIIVCTICSCM